MDVRAPKHLSSNLVHLTSRARMDIENTLTLEVEGNHF